MSMCRVFTCVVGRGCLLWPVCSLDKTLIAFALLHSVLQDQICLLLQVSLNFLLLDSIALWQKGHLFWVLVLESLEGVQRTVQLLWHYWLGHRLGLLWYWMVCLGNKWDHSVIFEIVLKYYILDSRREIEGRGEKERYTHLNGEFQRIARREFLESVPQWSMQRNRGKQQNRKD